MPKRSRKGVVIRPERVVATDQGERGQRNLHRARRRPLPDHQIEFEILHGGIKDFLHRGAEAMNLIDKKNITRFEIGEDGSEISRLGQHRPRGGAKADAQFLGDDLGQGRLAQTRRTGKQNMVQRLPGLWPLR